jgi:hypothetical protein
METGEDPWRSLSERLTHVLSGIAVSAGQEDELRERVDLCVRDGRAGELSSGGLLLRIRR